MKKTVAGIVAGGISAVALGLGAASLAYADPTASPSTPSATSTPSTTDQRGEMGGRHGERGVGSPELATKLAQKLGVEEAKVSEALTAVHEERKTSTPSTPGTRPDPATREAALATALANKLGIDEAKVKTALDEVRTEANATRRTAFSTQLDQAVTAGKLTRDEANAVLKAANAGVIPMGGRGR